MSPALASEAGATSKRRWQADAALFTVALAWGLTFVVVKGALQQISTLYFLGLRFSLATLCMLPILVPVWKGERHRLLRGLRSGAAAGVFLWLGYLLQTFGLRYTSVGNSGFLTGLYVPLVPLIGAAVYRRKPTWVEAAGVTMAALGMLVLTAPAMGQAFRLNTGDLLTLGCAVAFAFHLLLLGYFSQRESFPAVAVGQIATTALLSFAGLPLDLPHAVWSYSVVGAIAITGVFATALAFTLQTWAQQYTSATRTAVIFALEPVFALATAVLISREKLTAAAVAGGGLILAGILLVELKPFSGEESSSVDVVP